MMPIVNVIPKAYFTFFISFFGHKITWTMNLRLMTPQNEWFLFLTITLYYAPYAVALNEHFCFVLNFSLRPWRVEFFVSAYCQLMPWLRCTLATLWYSFYRFCRCFIKIMCVGVYWFIICMVRPQSNEKSTRTGKKKNRK